MNRDEKRVLRKRVREAMAECDRDRLLAESEVVMRRLESVPEFRDARVVALYWSMDDEVATHDFAEKWCREKVVLLPVVDGQQMTFRRFLSAREMSCGEFDILEPIAEPIAELASESQYGGGHCLWPDKIDVVVVPGVAFDSLGHRLGRGRGYYDRFLATSDTFNIGVCFAAQFVDCVPCEEHDVTMDKVISAG